MEDGGHGFPLLFWYRKRKLRRFLSQRKSGSVSRSSTGVVGVRRMSAVALCGKDEASGEGGLSNVIEADFQGLHHFAMCWRLLVAAVFI